VRSLALISRPVKAKSSFLFNSSTNLIFIPINVNGVELNFLLDTGVEETILPGSTTRIK
jgi:predicted aspartyl protease